jgi:hypothetical protein
VYRDRKNEGCKSKIRFRHVPVDVAKSGVNAVKREYAQIKSSEMPRSCGAGTNQASKNSESLQTSGEA